jgi:CBS domain-containing protein
MKVRDVMSTDVVTVQPDAPLKRAAELLVEHRISGLPVCDASGRVLGVLSEHDLLFKESGPPERPSGLFWWLVDERDYDELVKPDARTAGEAMSEPALTIAPGRRVAEAARLMVEHRVNRLPVVADETLVGIVTRADLVRAFTRSDDDIAREIREDVFERVLWLDPNGIQVEVADGEVTIGGSVESDVDVALVERFVSRVPGVVSVTSTLRAPGAVA